jgi:hypothetical protein
VAHPVEALGQLSLSSKDAMVSAATSISNQTISYTNTEVGPVAGPSTLVRVSTSQATVPSQFGTPRCIPLHGTLQTMHCQAYTHSYPLSEHLDALLAGTPPDCPECTALEATRSLIGKRPRGIGKLRPSVVLYNEEHKDGEGVGEVANKDLIGGRGRGADLLIVVGTSLRVPGTKRIVREFSKAVKARAEAAREAARERAEEREKATTSSSRVYLPTPSATPTSTPSPRRSPAVDDTPAPVTSIFLNLDFPVPTREWDGVFDVWLQGDAQKFAEAIEEEMEREERGKAHLEERRRRREKERAEKAERLEREREEKERLEREVAERAKVKKKCKEKQRRAHLLDGNDSPHTSLEGKLRAKEKRQHAKLKLSPSTPKRSPSRRAAPKVVSHGTTVPARKRRVNLVVKGIVSKSPIIYDDEELGEGSLSSSGSVPSTPVDSEVSLSEHMIHEDSDSCPRGEERREYKHDLLLEEADPPAVHHRRHRHRHRHVSQQPSPPSHVPYADTTPEPHEYRDPLEALLPTQIPTSSARYEPYEPPSRRFDYNRYGNVLENQDQDYFFGKWRANTIVTDVEGARKRRRSSGYRNVQEVEEGGRSAGDVYARGCDDDRCSCRHGYTDLHVRASAPAYRDDYSRRVYDYAHESVHPDRGVSYRWKEYQPRKSQENVRKQQERYDLRAQSQYSRAYLPTSRVCDDDYTPRRPPTPVSPPRFDDVEDMEVDIMTMDDDHSATYLQSSSLLKGPGIATPVRSRTSAYGRSRRRRGSEYHVPVAHPHSTSQADDYICGSTPGAPKAERKWHERRRSASPVKVMKTYQSSYARMREEEEMVRPSPRACCSHYDVDDITHGAGENAGNNGHSGNRAVSAQLKHGVPAILVRRPSYGTEGVVRDYEPVGSISTDDAREAGWSRGE